jgi:predicted DNA-binding transcriptional regulator AlpA
MQNENLQLIAAKPLLEMLGGISVMTLWRWMNAGKFPKPVIANRGCHRLWRVSDIAAWQEANRENRKSLIERDVA